jgi:argininosuccinate synthase
MSRIVVAHSGGFESSVALARLAEPRDAEVVSVTLDVGQGCNLAAIRERSLGLGARRAHVLDARLEFARDYALPTLQAGATLAGDCPPIRALPAPLVARTLVETARMERAHCVAHTAAGAEESRLHRLLASLDDRLEVIAIRAEWARSSFDAERFARERRLPIQPASPLAGIEANVWGRSIAGAPAGDDALPAPPRTYTLTRSLSECPDAPAVVRIGFDRGTPVSVNDIDLPLLELVESLEIIGGTHGAGRFLVPAGGRTTFAEVCEAPAAALLRVAHRALERRTMPPELAGLKSRVGALYADVVQEGRWFLPARGALDAFVGAIGTGVTGQVALRVSRGAIAVLDVRPGSHADGQPAPLLHESA